MILSLAGFILGAMLGAYRARKADGNRLDMLQYGAVYGIIFAVIGMILTVVILRNG